MCYNLSAIIFKGHMKQPVYQAYSPIQETRRLNVVHQACDISNLSLVESGFVELASQAPPVLGRDHVRSTLFESKPLISCSASLKTLTILRLNSHPDIMPKEEDAQENTCGLCEVTENKQR